MLKMKHYILAASSLFMLASCSSLDDKNSKSDTYKDNLGIDHCSKHDVALEHMSGYHLDYRNALVSFDETYSKYASRYPNSIGPSFTTHKTKLNTIKGDHSYCRKCEELMQKKLR
jgi:hypothetical protein